LIIIEPSPEMNVSTGLRSDEANDSLFTTPVATVVSENQAVLPLNLSLVELFESHEKQSCLIPEVEILQLIGDAISTSCSTTTPVPEISGPQDVLTGDGCGDAKRTVIAVRSEVRPKRRSLWSRVKRFAWRMFCCGAIDMDR